ARGELRRARRGARGGLGSPGGHARRGGRRPPGRRADPRADPRRAGQRALRIVHASARGMTMSDITWEPVRGFEDIKYEKSGEGIAKVTINRPRVRNAFRPKTVKELMAAFAEARDDAGVGVIILTGEGPEAFCSGGDQRVRGEGGY